MALRNNLTRRYPALPLPRGAETRPPTTDCSDKSQREVARVEVGDGEHTNGFHHGIARVFHRNQEIQRKRWQEDVDTAILRTGQPVPRKYWEYPEFEKGDIHEHCAYCLGVHPPPVPVKPGGHLALHDLPAELLQHVFSFLDPWTLASVALVSQHMRGVACSLLDSMGCVALQWERKEGPGGGWEVAYKRWFFSPYFQPITKWGLHSEGLCPHTSRLAPST